MIKPLINVDDVLTNLATESVKRGEKLRTTVRDITLQALQTRELSLAQIKGVLKSVTIGVSMGATGNQVTVDKILGDALAGMDAALLKAVEASSIALQQLGMAGEDFEASKLKKAVGDLDRLEDEFLKTVKQASGNANENIRSRWAAILKNTNVGSTEAGAQAAAAVAAFGQQMQQAMREQRKQSVRAAYRLSQNFGTLASGVLIGLTEGMHKTASSKSATPKQGGMGRQRRAAKSGKLTAAPKKPRKRT